MRNPSVREDNAYLPPGGWGSAVASEGHLHCSRNLARQSVRRVCIRTPHDSRIVPARNCGKRIQWNQPTSDRHYKMFYCPIALSTFIRRSLQGASRLDKPPISAGPQPRGLPAFYASLQLNTRGFSLNCFQPISLGVWAIASFLQFKFLFYFSFCLRNRPRVCDIAKVL